MHLDRHRPNGRAETDSALILAAFVCLRRPNVSCVQRDQRKIEIVKNFLVFVFVLAAALAALGYWRGWFDVSNQGQIDIQVDSAKFKSDKEAFGKSVGEKTKALKDEVASLWTKTEGMTGDDKACAQKELADLKAQHDRIEQQINELEEAGQDRFASIKHDLSKSLDEVERKIEELKNKLEKGKDK
jgi:hypothetical protein